MRDLHYSLLQLNLMVRDTIESELAQEYWVETELSECRESRGHCYMELIEKDERLSTPVARASAKCWASKWSMLSPYFERTTGQKLHAGMKVLLKVYPQFHEAFGFSWIVTDIDPTYTIGDMARRRQEIIRQLKEAGVFDLQRELLLPLFCQRIAVVSSQTAAGYGDFCNQLSESGFAFETQLFPAIMQGEQVEQSIIGALNAIYDHQTAFDCVVIIRGGGATADMSGFDTLALAENVAQFPLPIITGIGHDRDESILDMVSFQRVKTPTAAAQFLIENLGATLDRIERAQERVVNCITNRLSTLNNQLTTLQARIPSAAIADITRHEARLQNLSFQLKSLPEKQLQQQLHRLELLEQRASLLDPALLLKRGYSITLLNGKAVRDAKQLKKGDILETRIEHGTIKSEVI